MKDSSHDISLLLKLCFVADVKELEYVSALLQTGKVQRTDGSISAQDIVLSLYSRFGIKVEEERVQTLVLDELAGPLHHHRHGTISSVDEKKSDGESYLDLCQFVAILMIPILLGGPDGGGGDDDDEKSGGIDNERIIEWFEASVRKAMEEGPCGGGEITRDNLRSVFEIYGEFHVSDQVLDEMVAAAAAAAGADGGGSPTSADLKRALTADLALFSSAWKNSDTTLLEDAQNAETVSTPVDKKGSSVARTLDTTGEDLEQSPTWADPVHQNPAESGSSDTESKLIQATSTTTHKHKHTLHRAFTAPFIDLVSDTLNRPVYMALLWTAGTAAYLSYVFQVSDQRSGEDYYWANYECPDSMGNTSCDIVTGIIGWLAQLVQVNELAVKRLIVFCEQNQGLFTSKFLSLNLSAQLARVCLFGLFQFGQ